MADGDAGAAGDVHEDGPRVTTPALQWDRFVNTVKERKIDAAMWATRFLTLLFACLYFLPIIG